MQMVRMRSSRTGVAWKLKRKAWGRVAAWMAVMVLGSWATWTEGAAVAVAKAAVDPEARPAEMTRAQIQINWFPEAEFGGFYQALLDGLYAERNVAMEILPGGPGVNPIVMVAAGRAIFGVANADQFMIGRSQGMPLVAVMAVFQKYPQGIMVHEESGIEDFADIAERGTRVAVSNNQVYVSWLIHKFGWKEEQLLTYTGQLGEWLIDKSRGIQAFLTSEPFVARQMGANVKFLSLPDLAGFNPYARILFTTKNVIENRPELVNAVVAASLEGWRRYMASPEAVNKYLVSIAPDETEEALMYSWETMKDLIFTGDALEHGLGVMTAARWEELYDQFKEMGLIDPAADPAEAWTDVFFLPHLQK